MATAADEFSPIQDEMLPRESITRLMRQRISNYMALCEDPSLYQSVRNMSQFISDDYGNRFLIELIQNAHDAHLAGRCDGEVSIVLRAEEGVHGCLYVANGGSGFRSENLRAITNIALSSKPVNEGIGNKGLGFRSVLQICDWPEIYSVHREGGSGKFDGYCFRFATVDDLKDLVPDRSADEIEEMARNLPCWHVPVPVEPGDEVAPFAANGFATVVRLPLKSADSLEVVRTEISALLASKVPLQLFLDRLQRISLDDGSGKPVSLHRSSAKTWRFHPKLGAVNSFVEVVSLHLGTIEFLVAHWDIEQAVFNDALQTSLDKSEIPETWREWKGNARVSVAVPIGEQLDAGRLYCFLPLGEQGKSPFPGHLNANFYTKMDRRSVDPSLAVNKLFMQTAAWLSCQLISFLVEENWERAGNAVVSLLCWELSYAKSLSLAMGDEGRGILTREFLPARGSGNKFVWGSPAETYSWFASPDDYLSPKQICTLDGGQLLIESLTARQRAALDSLYQVLRDDDFQPPSFVVADWVERIAVHMHSERAAPDQWAAFYDEVATVLNGQARALFGKRFLLSVSGDLISSELPLTRTSGRMKRAADVYFSPVMSFDADVDDRDSKDALPLERLPATLRKGFAILNRDIPWLKEDGGHRAGRSFLIAGKLAREYDTRDVLRTLAGVTRTATVSRTREQALEWAFRLWNSARSLSDKETLAAGFFVPTAEEWIEAGTAIFGAGWNTTNGKKLYALLRVTAGRSEDLALSIRRLILDPSDWPIHHGAPADWQRFLIATGVTDCLRPIGGETVTSQAVAIRASLPLSVAVAVPGIPDEMRSIWRERLVADCSRMWTTRQYRAEIQPWRIPGQNEHEVFAPEIRRDFAVQVALCMKTVRDEHRSFRATRDDTGTESHRLDTPLVAFLADASWVPVSRPGSQIFFVTPGEAWYFSTSEDRPPRFIDFILHDVAAALDPSALAWLVDKGGLGLFNDTQHAGRALQRLTDAASVTISDIRDVRRYQELFRKTWAAARETASLETGAAVPVMVKGQITLVSDSSDEFTVAHFDDERDSLTRQLLEELGEPVFSFVHGDIEAAWQWVNTSTPGKFRRISEEPAEIYVDGAKFDESTPRQLLTELLGSWIIDFLVCVAEHKSSAFVSTTQATLGRMRRAALTLSIVRGHQVEIGHGDYLVALPQPLRGVLALNRPTGPVLIVQTSEEKLSLVQLASSASQLAMALGARELTYGLDAALLRLSAMLRDQGAEAPDDATIASALGISLDAVKQTRHLASGDMASILDLAIPLSACVGDPEITSRLREIASDDKAGNTELRDALDPLAAVLKLSTPILEERLVPILDLAGLKATFNLPIARLNAAISTLGGRYKKLSNEYLHRELWARHLRQRQPAISEELRARALASFDRGERLSAYLSARDAMLDIPIDTLWFETVDELCDSAMDAHVEKWINEVLPADSNMSLDLSIGDVRAANGAKVRSFCEKFSPLFAAWLRLPGTVVSANARDMWGGPASASDACLALARTNGWLDFRLLSDENVAAWLMADDLWPANRPLSLDLSNWGISSKSLADSVGRAESERAEQKRQSMIVEFNGVELSAQPSGYAAIAAAVAAISDQAPALNNASADETTLNTVPPGNTSGNRTGGTSGSLPKLSESRMSDEQKSAVGLIGELWAREWLRRRHKLESVNENVWVSAYRDKVLNTTGGSDKLGYDFVVTTKSRAYYYEVKASTGDPLQFEMGPTELYAAQRYRADREHQYRILYLAFVGDPAKLRASLLHNPFSSKGAKIHPVGRGSVLFKFDPN